MTTSSADTPAEHQSYGGIFDGFEGYRTAIRNDHIQVLRQGLVVLDTNVLLDLYRYGKQGRDDLIAALRAIGDRLWVPNHAMVEFWRNREGILKDPGGTAVLIRTLGSNTDAIFKAVDLWGKQRSHPKATVEGLTQELTECLARLRDKVTQLSEEETETWARDTSKDEVLLQLEQILQGKVGRPLDEGAHKAALIEAKRRGDNQIPPGYLDAKKPEPDSAGDYLVWEQLLVEAAQRQLDVLFITRDAKDDWVRKEGGEIRGPRIELIHELLARTGRDFYLRTPAQLLDLAKESLNVSIHTDSVENANRLSRELTDRERLVAQGWVHSAVDKILHWEGFDVFLSKLNALDPVAGTALKLASLAEGWIDVRLMEEMGIATSGEKLQAIGSTIQDVLAHEVGNGNLPERALTLLEPHYYDMDQEVLAYRIRPEFLEPIRLSAMFAERREGTSAVHDSSLHWWAVKTDPNKPSFVWKSALDKWFSENDPRNDN
ncbi:hypothetical protein NIBR502772_22010 [Pseudarthrobacter sp. NIBRBAC000502772]|uniref:PIN-like domain-containing protein n=1 Tax=Pseudarthrobacter sp. NIBRBAC000502772 TaxID=2590775 RepID=UPI0011301A85|nr:PIN-like domain-containing protein [Pseudarthrobacter sp. NIBRBAC000502772]QDG68525.1 hypothetical protein NIBR502772_22010 [Pseudarthrobacter sp. NIBRBAC000502772]